MVGLQGRCSPAYLRLKELIDEGYVGEVLSCHLSAFGAGGLERTSDRVWAGDRSAGVGTLSISFGHAIDALCFCVGELVEVASVVSTQVPRWRITDLDATVDVTAADNVLVSGKLANGAVVSAHVASVPWHGSGLKVQIFGREGTLVYEGSHIAHNRLEGARADERALHEMEVPERLTWVPDDVPKGSPFNVAQMYRRFGESIRNGSAVEPNFDTAVRRHALLEAIQTSSDQGSRAAPEATPHG
jgi:predicted dehydrogenase